MNEVDFNSADEGVVLVLAPIGRDAEGARLLFDEAGIACRVFPSFQVLLDAMDDRTGVILIAEEAVDERLLPTFITRLEQQPVARVRLPFGEAVRISTSADRWELHVNKLTERARTAFRDVEGLFQTRAGSLRSIARSVIGFEPDAGALNAAYLRAKEKSLALLPLKIDVANPSPASGWRQMERLGLEVEVNQLAGVLVLHGEADDRPRRTLRRHLTQTGKKLNDVVWQMVAGIG